MANEIRVRQIAIGGLVEDNPLTSGATTLTSAGLAAVASGISSSQHLAIILDPDGIDGAPEIIWVTALTAGAGSATVLRGQESTTARAHAAGTPWIHGPTLRDFLLAGPGLPYTHDPAMQDSTALTLGASNNAHYQRVNGAGLVGKIRLYVIVSSGNISVAVYSPSTGLGASSAPLTRVATSGTVACPAAGAREIALDVSVFVDSTYWFAISADNNTASFVRAYTQNNNALSAGLAGYQATAHPLPSTPTMTQSDGSLALTAILIGVP
jgi:hypothetical protein